MTRDVSRTDLIEASILWFAWYRTRIVDFYVPQWLWRSVFDYTYISVVKGNRTRVYTIRYYVLESAVNATLLNLGSDCVDFLPTRFVKLLRFEFRSCCSVVSAFVYILFALTFDTDHVLSKENQWRHTDDTNFRRTKNPEDDRGQVQKKDSMNHELSNSVMIVMVCFWNLQSDRDRNDIPKFHFVKFHLMDNETSLFFKVFLFLIVSSLSEDSAIHGGNCHFANGIGDYRLIKINLKLIDHFFFTDINLCAYSNIESKDRQKKDQMSTSLFLKS